MALVFTGWELSASLADHGGNVSNLSWEYDLATVPDYATALTEGASLLVDLAVITNAEISGYRVASVFSEDSFALPIAGVENEDKASLTFQLDGTNGKGNLKIPAPVSAGAFNLFGVIGAAANQMVLTQAALVAYTDNFRAGASFNISHGHKLVTLLVGKRISAKNKNG